MKILHIVSGNLDGGAARGAYWLHKALFKLHALQSLENSTIMNKMINGGNFIFCNQSDPCIDIYEYLKYTDILITDNSSVLFDYSLITPRPKTNNWDEVIEEISNIIVKKNDRFKDERKSINSMFNHYQDTLSCK